MQESKETIIASYKRRLVDSRVIVPVEREVWEGFYQKGDERKTVTLRCWQIDPDNVPKGFAFQGGKYQYDLRRHNGKRPLAWRVAFLGHERYDDKNYTLSHLCHNEKCYNWEHHCLESLAYNKARNGCPGGRYCFHDPRCIVPGPFYK